FPCRVSIEARIARTDGADITGDRGSNIRRLNPEALLEFGFGHPEFLRVENGLDRLLFERRCPPIPEKGRAVATIEQCRRVPRPHSATDPARNGTAIRKCELRIMTTRTR